MAELVRHHTGQLIVVGHLQKPGVKIDASARNRKGIRLFIFNDVETVFKIGPCDRCDEPVSDGAHAVIQGGIFDDGHLARDLAGDLCTELPLFGDGDDVEILHQRFHVRATGQKTNSKKKATIRTVHGVYFTDADSF